MLEPFVCAECGAAFVRDRRTQIACSPRCHQKLYRAGKSVRATLTKEEQRERANIRARRWRANQAAKQAAKQITSQTNQPVGIPQPYERRCMNCMNYFTYDPVSKLLPGCSMKCRRLIAKWAAEGDLLLNLMEPGPQRPKLLRKIEIYTNRENGSIISVMMNGKPQLYEIISCDP